MSELGSPAPQRAEPLLLRTPPRSRWLGLIVSVAAVAATTALIYPIRSVAPAVSTGVVYLLAVLLVSTFWGLRLGLLTALMSALAFNWFHIPPTGRFTISEGENWVALAMFFIVAGVASSVAELARNRASEAEDRRREADLAAETARLLLGSARLEGSLAEASRQLATALDLPWAEIRVDADADVARRGVVVALETGADREAALVLPDSTAPETLERIRERIAPSLEALLAAALYRELLQTEVVETRALRRSDEIKTAVLRSVSHDLRSPLTAILTSAEAVGSPSLTGDEREGLGRAIGEEASRLSRLVDKLLDMSRLQGGEADPRTDWCSVEEAIRSALEEVGAREGEFKLTLDRDLPLIRADAAQLERAFANLLENARRYSGGHPVQVRGRVVGTRLGMRIVDRGPGVAKADLKRIFEPFYRSAHSGDHKGSGLGLAIARGFIEVNGGRVWAESLPGQGTSFVIEFPLELAEATPEGARSAAESPA